VDYPQPDRPTDWQLGILFGPQPAGLFDVVGQLAAITSLMEFLTLDLLATLVDETPREVYQATLKDHPIKVFNRVEERATILSEDLKPVVLVTVRQLRQMRDHRNRYVHAIWSRYAGGWSKDGSSGENQDVARVALTAAELALRLLGLIEDCQEEQNQRLRMTGLPA
jgi:hypothetical protein